MNYSKTVERKSSVKLEKFFWLLVYFLSPIIPIAFIYNSDIRKFSILTYFIPLVAATTGFVWLVYQFVLIARPKFIERCFGLDKFYIFHGLMPIISVALIFLHKMLVDEDSYKGLLTNLGDLAFEIFLGVVVLGLLFITSSILLKIKPIGMIKNFFQKYPLFKYKNQVLIHNLSVVAYIIMFIHVLLTPAIKKDFASRLVFTLYFTLGLCFYIYHTLIKKISLKKDMYIVKDVVQESERMWTLKLIPNYKNIFPYKPGQFSYIKIFGQNVKEEVHPFSISSSPTNKDYISFTIKELGDFTNEIDVHSCGYYICGPSILTNGVISSLKNMTVKKEYIHFEKFSM